LAPPLLGEQSGAILRELKFSESEIQIAMTEACTARK